MARNVMLGIRLEPAERHAMTLAAGNEDRSASALGRLILLAWLRENGWLRETKAPAKRTRRGEGGHD